MSVNPESHTIFNTNSIGQLKIITLSVAFLSAIVFLDSSIMWTMYPLVKVLIYALKFACLILIPFLLLRNEKNNFLFFLLFMPLAWFVMDENSLSGIVQYTFSSIVPLCIFALLDDQMKLKIVKLLIKILYIFLLIGIPIYILLQFTPLPHISYKRSGDGREYYNYFFLYSTNGTGFITKRFTSIYEEPGSLGSLIALIIFYLRPIMKKMQYWVFVICGTLTFSLFFLGVLLPLIYFSNMRSYSLPKKLFRIILFFAIIVMAYFSLNAFAQSTKGQGVYEVLFYNRFEWKSGFIVGIHNNRDAGIEGFDKAYDQFNTEVTTLEYWIGNGKNTVKESFGTSGLSYRISHYEKGMLVTLYMFLLLFALHDWRKNAFFSIVSMGFLIAFYFQRPTLYLHTFIIIIYCGLVIIPRMKLNPATKKQLE